MLNPTEAKLSVSNICLFVYVKTIISAEHVIPDNSLTVRVHNTAQDIQQQQ